MLKQIGLVPRVIFAIILGIGLGFVLPESAVRVFATINIFFSSFLSYFIPLLMLGFITNGFARISNHGGRLLLITILISWFFTLFSGFLTLGVCEFSYPKIFANPELFDLIEMEPSSVQAYFSVSIPPLIDPLTAILTAFLIGMGISATKSQTLQDLVADFESILHLVINRIFLPLLPLYIFGLFLKMTFEGQITPVFQAFHKVILIIFLITLAVLAIQYLLAGVMYRRNPLKLFYHMIPAYLTAFGTQSSTATIPVTLQQTLKNEVHPDITRFVIPLCASIHLSGSMIKIIGCALAIICITDTALLPSQVYGFILLLSFTLIAAPGIPGGAMMAAIGLLESMFGFGESEVGLMIALYIVMDSFGTACNVTGDGAVALMINWFADKTGSSSKSQPPTVSGSTLK